MKKNISVNDALHKGTIKFVYIPVLLFFSCFGYFFYLFVMNDFGPWIIFVGSFLGILVCWLNWSLFIVDWKIWAYENVRNVHEFKRKAIEQKLLWEDGSWFEKTEFKSYNQKQKLRQLEKKFLEEDVYLDDLNVASETKIYCVKTNPVFEYIIFFVFLGIGIYTYINNKSFVFWLFLPLIGAYILYSTLSKRYDSSPQIIINEFGIQLKNDELIKWDEIENEKVYLKKTGKFYLHYLSFNDIEICIINLNISFKDLENYLQVYRTRFKVSNPN